MGINPTPTLAGTRAILIFSVSEATNQHDILLQEVVWEIRQSRSKNRLKCQEKDGDLGLDL